MLSFRARPAGGAAEASRRAVVLPSRIPARCVARRRLGQRAARCTPGDSHRESCRCGAAGVGRRPGGRATPCPRPGPACDRLRQGRGADRPTSSPWPARETRRWRSTSTPSSRRLAPARTGSRTPTMRTSSAPAALPMHRYRRSAGSRRTARSDGCRRASARSPSYVCGIPRSRCANWRQNAGRRPRKRLRSAGSASSSILQNTIFTHVALRGPMLHTFVRRWVRARRPVGFRPVCRLGPERGATGGEGRRRSFPLRPASTCGSLVSALRITTEGSLRVRD